MNIKKYSWLAALPMVFTACQEDALVENQPQGELIYSLSAHVNGGTADSRAQIQLNNPLSGEEFFYWNESDSINIYQNTGKEFKRSVFHIADSYTEPTQGASKSATFNTTTPVYASANYLAFYPAYRPIEYNELVMHITNGLGFHEGNHDKVWETYFRENMFMMDKGTFSGTDNASVSFKQLCSLFRISYVNCTSEEKYVNSFKFTSNGSQLFSEECHYHADTDEMEYLHGKSELGVGTDGLTVPAGESTELYALFFPSEFGDGNLTITLNGQGIDRMIDIPIADIAKANPNDTAFVAGKRYWFKITETEDGLVWTKNYTGGPVEQLYKEVSDFDELEKALTLQANFLHVHLKNDIELEKPLTILNDGSTNIYLNEHTLSLSENYSTGDELGVINIDGSNLDNITTTGKHLTIKDGTLQGRDGDMLNDYFLNIVSKDGGINGALDLQNVTISTGTAIPNAVRMYYSRVEIRDVVELGSTTITTPGYAFYYEGPTDVNNYANLYIKAGVGIITGDFYLDNLKVSVKIEEGTVKGDLDVNSSVNTEEIKESVSVASGLVESGFSGWNWATVLIKNQNYEVSTFEDLLKALNNPQVDVEDTYILLLKDIELESPLTINKPVQLFMEGKTISLSEKFSWDDAEALITATKGGLEISGGTILGPTTGTPIEKYVFKTEFDSEQEGTLQPTRLHLESVTVNAGDIKNGVYVKGTGASVSKSSITTSGKAFVNEYNSSYYNVTIENSTVVGYIYLVFNTAENISRNELYIHSGSSVTGDLIIAGTAAENAEGYIVEVNNSTVEGDNWPTTDDGGDEGGETEQPDYSGVFEGSVASFAELKEAVKYSRASIRIDADFVLEEPLILNNYVSMQMYGHTLTVKDGISGIENMFEVKNDVYIYNGHFVGPIQESSLKYFFGVYGDYDTKYQFTLQGVTIDAKGIWGGVTLSQSRFDMNNFVDGETSINSSITATTSEAVNLNSEGEAVVWGGALVGDVSIFGGSFTIYAGTINGGLSTSEYYTLEVHEGVNIVTPDGRNPWPDYRIPKTDE